MNKKYIDIVTHYERCFAKHGDTHLGVDWPKKEHVDLRYRIMLEVIKGADAEKITLLDFGCGASHLYDYIKRKKLSNVNYSGLDLSAQFIKLCKQKYPNNIYYCTDILANDADIPNFDYIILNGVFTEKQNLSYEDMFTYCKQMLTALFQKTNKGMAFNFMSKAVDWERDDLFHLSTDLLIDFLTKNLSRHFVIRNDYGLYEYTVYLYRKSEEKENSEQTCQK